MSTQADFLEQYPEFLAAASRIQDLLIQLNESVKQAENLGLSIWLTAVNKKASSSQPNSALSVDIALELRF